MKNIACTMSLLGALTGAAFGADYTWLASPASANWNTADANWSGAGSVWSNGSDNNASFAASVTQAITASAVTLSNLTFGADGYAVSGGPLLMYGSATVSNGCSALLAATMTNVGVWAKQGPGTLALNPGAGVSNRFFALNAVEGVLHVAGGTMLVTQSGSNPETSPALWIRGGTLVAGGGALKTTGGAYARVSNFGTLVVTNGTVDLTGNNELLNAFRSPGVTTVSGNGVLDVQMIRVSDNTSNLVSSSVVNINTGGTVRIWRFNMPDVARAGTVNLNGGTVVATYTGGTLSMLGWADGRWNNIAVNVLAGGAIFDSNGRNIEILKGLAGTAGDGGLTKKGAGTLYLRANSGYNGGTRLLGGTLCVSNDLHLGAVPAVPATNIFVLANATLQSENSHALNAYRTVVISNGVTLTVDTQAYAQTIPGAVVGDGGLVKAGAGTLTLAAPCTYAGATTVSNGTLKLTRVPVPVSALVNAGFELPATNGWRYITGSDGVPGGWLFSNGGVGRNGSPWVNTAPQGMQVGFLQNGNVWQTSAIPQTATYRLSFKASNRPGYPANNLNVKIDGATVLSLPSATINNGGKFKTYDVEANLTAGAHEVRFEGITPGGDTAVALDDVQVGRIDGSTPGTLPEGTRLSVLEGAAVDLNGASQTVAALSGFGRVFNGSATNATLTVGDATSASFGGTIEGALALLKTGGGTLTLGGTNTYTGDTRVQAGTLRLGLPAGASVAVPNASFETHGTLTYYPPPWVSWDYLAPVDAWSYIGSNAGLCLHGEPWVSASALIDGTTVAFIQHIGGFSNTVTIPHDGLYSLSFLAGKRPGASMPSQDLSVDIDGMIRLAYTAAQIPNELRSVYGTNLFLAGGTHTLAFRSIVGGGNIWLDRIELTSLGCSLPTGTVLAVEAGAVFDLNGNTQSLAQVSGSGLVSNGTVRLTGSIAPGGTNVVGTLTLAATPLFSGATLLADVGAGGAGDRLDVRGDLDLTGLSLTVANTGSLDKTKPYTLATCTGVLTGVFSGHNLPAPWIVRYDASGKRAYLICNCGTLISVL